MDWSLSFLKKKKPNTHYVFLFWKKVRGKKKKWVELGGNTGTLAG
jgi:hypothetical protein